MSDDTAAIDPRRLPRSTERMPLRFSQGTIAIATVGVALATLLVGSPREW